MIFVPFARLGFYLTNKTKKQQSEQTLTNPVNLDENLSDQAVFCNLITGVSETKHTFHKQLIWVCLERQEQFTLFQLKQFVLYYLKESFS